jgi:hypothetical protein
LPQDVTGYDTVQIVSRARCEVRDAIRAFIRGALLDPRRLRYYPQYEQMAEGLRNGTLRWQDFRAHLKTYRVDSDTVGVFERYNSGAVGYEFTFDIEEKNTNGAGFDFLGAVTNGTVKLGVTASNELVRGNTRTFRVVDSFEFLATLLEEAYCDPNQFPIHAQLSRPNMVYPIVGSLNLIELIGTFLNLNQWGNLVGLAEPAAEREIPTIVDVIEFTTKVSGGASPTVELAPRKQFWPTRATLATLNVREDLHRLRIVVKLPPKEWTPSTIAERRTLAAQRRTAAGERRTPVVTSSARRIEASVAEELALQPSRELIEARIKFLKEARGIIIE